MLVFVYGTLKRNYGNNVILQHGRFIDNDIIDGYKLIFSHDRGGFPYAIENEGTGIKGEVFDITGDNFERTLSRLDNLEGHPDWYRRTEATTRTGRDVEFYLMPTPPARQVECDFHEDVNAYEWHRG
jgi:gamma-glutamylcyclotransferase (GGCT)/AIG2-like uncharacterized protein YtfP